MPSATGDNAKQSGLRQKLAANKPKPDRIHKMVALSRLICPVGSGRPAVRGFNASNLRSTMRLKDIAHVRAQTIAAKINANVRQPGQPRWSRAATTMAARAKGRAKIVWESLTNSAKVLKAGNL